MNKILEALEKVAEMKRKKEATTKIKPDYSFAPYSKCLNDDERKARRKEYDKRYKEANKEKIKIRHRKYYLEHQEKCKEYSKNYYEQNKKNTSVG